MKTTISDLRYADFSEWFIGHSGSTYWTKKDSEKAEIFRKIESNLVNKILKDHLAMELHPERADFIITNKDFFRRIFNKIEDNSIEDFGGELAYSVVSEYTSSFFPEIK